MRRKGLSTSIIILATVTFGLGGIGYSVFLPQDVVNTVNNQIQETNAVTKANVIDTHLQESYMEDAMNWSIYASVYRFGKEPYEVKDWSESSIEGPQNLEDNLTEQASEDFRNWYLGEEDIPEGCSISSEPFDVTVEERYAIYEDREGANITIESPGPVNVTCSTETGSNHVMIPPPKLNRSYEARFFHMYNLSQSLTRSDSFRFAAEGVAMNVSNYLQVTNIPPGGFTGLKWKNYYNCDTEEGDGTNTQDPPYNDGPDCAPDWGKFVVGSDNLTNTLRAAENKYSNRVEDPLESEVDEVGNKWANNPSIWTPSGVDESDFDDFDVEVEVQTVEYRIYNVKRTYLDRRVGACKLSHNSELPENEFRFVKAGAEGSVSNWGCNDCDFPDCPTDCGGSVCDGDVECDDCDKECTANCNGCSTDVSIGYTGDPCSGIDCGTEEEMKENVTGEFSCSCGGASNYSNCEPPEWFPIWQDPPNSVNDGKAEGGSLDGSLPDEYAGRDCIGEKTPDGYSGDSCELDNACKKNENGWRADTTVARDGDATALKFEEGQYRKCDNEDEIYGGMDNPWEISLYQESESSDIEWGRSEFGKRKFTGGYDSDKIISASMLRSEMRPLERGVRASLPSPDDEDSDSSTSDSDSDSSTSDSDSDNKDATKDDAKDEEDTCDETCPDCDLNEECDFKFDATCDVEVGDGQVNFDKGDAAYENELVETIANYKFDLKAYVRFKITVEDKRYKIPTKDGLRHPQFISYYDHYAISTFEDDSRDSISSCIPSDPFDPDG